MWKSRFHFLFLFDGKVEAAGVLGGDYIYSVGRWIRNHCFGFRMDPVAQIGGRGESVKGSQDLTKVSTKCNFLSWSLFWTNTLRRYTGPLLDVSSLKARYDVRLSSALERSWGKALGT